MKQPSNDIFSSVAEPIILQEFIDRKEEFGVFYIRLPWEKSGRVTSLMQRELLTVTGDGQSTLKSLIQQHPRGKFYQARLYNKHHKELETIIPVEKKRLLMPIGNHCRGTQFNNMNQLITPELSKTFDTISKNFRGFYYGRYDIKADSLSDLVNGTVQKFWN